MLRAVAFGVGDRSGQKHCLDMVLGEPDREISGPLRLPGTVVILERDGDFTDAAGVAKREGQCRRHRE